MATSKSYECLPTYLVRTPTLPPSMLPDILSDPNAWCERELLTGDPLESRTGLTLWEAIEISSPSLLHSWKRYLDGVVLSPKRLRALKTSLVSYAIRACYRPTPFGTLAGVDIGSLDNDQATAPSLERTVLIRRPYSEANTACQRTDQELTDTTLLRAPGMMIVSDRAFYLARSIDDASVGFSYIWKSLKASGPIPDIMQILHQPRDYDEALELLSRRFPDVDRDSFTLILTKLCDALAVIPRGSHGLTLETVSTDKVHISLPEHVPRSTSSGIATEYYATRSPHSDSLTSGPFQVELRIPSPQQLPESVGKAASEAAGLLTRLSTLPPVPYWLRQFSDTFTEKFGTFLRVPLTYAMSEFSGVGPPATYLHPPRNNPWPPSQPTAEQYSRELRLFSIFANSLHQRLTTYRLQQDDIAALTLKDYNRFPACSSLDLFCSLKYKGLHDLENGNFQLVVGPTGATANAGRTFARFGELLGDGVTQHLRSAMPASIQDKKAIHAELVYTPMVTSAAAPGRRLHPYQYEIRFDDGMPSVDQDKCIWEQDLSIFTDESGRIHLYSERHNSPVIPHSTHQVNSVIAPNSARLLDELSWSYVSRPRNFDWGKLESSEFLPRLEYKNIIVSPTFWNFTPPKSLGGFSEFVDHFRQFAELWNIPDQVLMCQSDNLIPMRLSSSWAHRLLWSEHRNNGRPIKLQEMFWDPSTTSILDPREYVFSCILDESAGQPSNTSHSIPASYGPSDYAAYLPSREWLYLKLYTSTANVVEALSRMNDILTSYLPSPTQWYYVRYRDPDFHLRVRIKVSEPDSMGFLIQHLHESLTSNLDRPETIWKITVDTHVPEVGRYGGLECFSIVEELFCEDTRYAYSQLSLDLRDESVLCAAAGRFLQYAYSFLGSGLTMENLLPDWDEEPPRQKMTPTHRTVYHHLIELLRKEDGVYSLGRHGDYLVEQLVRKMLDQGRSDHIPSIFQSIVHMSCNRLVGLDSLAERIVVESIRRALRSPYGPVRRT